MTLCLPKMLASDDSDYLNMVETDCIMEALDDVIFNSSHMFQENNMVEQSIISNHLEDETDSNTEEIIDSSVPPRKKRKNLKWELRKRARKYLGIKGYELQTILKNGAFKFCQDHNLLATAALCSCGKSMTLVKSTQCSDRVVWHCGKKGHKNSVTVRKNSWFEKSKVPLSEHLWIIYMWIHEYSYASMVHEIEVAHQCLDIICNNCQEACLPILNTKTDPIGGPEKIIEVFEAKFKDFQDSKKKRRKGGSGDWIFCAFEQFSTNCVYLSVPDKKKQTLYDIFDKYILPGTKIYSHLWNIYVDIDEDSFNYLTNEKLLLFYDCNSKADIRSFKRFQNVARQSEPSLSYWDKHEFCEFMYRKTLYFAPDAFLTFLKDVSKIYSPENGLIKKDSPKPTPKTLKKLSTCQSEETQSKNGNKSKQEVEKLENGNNKQEKVTNLENVNEIQEGVTMSENGNKSQDKVMEPEKN